MRSQPGVNAEEVCRRIEAQTGLRARTTDQFLLGLHCLLIEEHGHTSEFRDNHHDRAIVGTIIRSDFLFVYARKPEAIWRLKAIGVTNWRLTGMVLLQAFVVGLMGFGLGTGMAAAFFEATLRKIATRGIILMWRRRR